MQLTSPQIQMAFKSTTSECWTVSSALVGVICLSLFLSLRPSTPSPSLPPLCFHPHNPPVCVCFSLPLSGLKLYALILGRVLGLVCLWKTTSHSGSSPSLELAMRLALALNFMWPRLFAIPPASASRVLGLPGVCVNMFNPSYW